MSSTTRLLVLGVVRLFQPVHGYDVRRELVTWHAEEWANAAPGSIYSALKSLTKDGMLEVVGTRQVGSRPERTTYRLTARGEHELSELLREHWWRVRMLVDPMVAAVSLLGFMDRAEAIGALEGRIAVIEGNLKQYEIVVAAIDDVETPAHVREMMRLIAARNLAEVGWARAFITRLNAGEYRTRGDADWVPASVAASQARSASKTRRAAHGDQPPLAPPARRATRAKRAGATAAAPAPARRKRGGRARAR